MGQTPSDENHGQCRREDIQSLAAHHGRMMIQWYEMVMDGDEELEGCFDSLCFKENLTLGQQKAVKATAEVNLAVYLLQKGKKHLTLNQIAAIEEVLRSYTENE